MLTLDEVRTTLRGPVDRRAPVAAAREAFEQSKTADPPSMLGAPIPDQMKPMLSAAFGQLESTSTTEQVRGLGASGGVATGIARLITSLSDIDRLESGDILVAETTSPPWTPLFGVAGAVVTDAGGPMSHVAIVAREYGIPAVVGTADATKRIADGQRIRVDGSAGTVDLLEA
jgi:rifampicin phosphotransferase